MKLLIDIDRAVADGLLSSELGGQLRKAAAADTLSLAINVLLALGVIAVAGGVLALFPDFAVATGFGAVLAALGIGIRVRWPKQWGFLGAASILVGALILSGGILVQWHGHTLAFLAVALLLLGLGAVAHSGLLAALSVVAVAGCIGSSVGYWHASYALWVDEPSFTIVLFSGLALLSLLVARRLRPDAARLAEIYGRLAVIWVNFGFWVGSLWGDYPLISWAQPEGEPRSAVLARRAAWLFIPADAFSIVWAIALLAVGAWAAWRNRRFVVNTVAVFGSIHFYTQWFERLDITPGLVIVTGIIAIAFATALWRYNAAKAPQG